MSLRKTFFVICLITSVLCLAAGYWIAGQWIGAMIAVLAGLAWWPAKKYPALSLAPVCLWGTVGLAVIGILIGSGPLLMIFGSTLALAAWDLLLLDSALGNHSLPEQTRQYENKHLQFLLLALSAGLFAVFLGRLLQIRIPFVVLILFIGFTLFALDRVLRSIKKTGKL